MMQPVSIETLLEVAFVSNPRCSPGGGSVAYRVQRPALEENAYVPAFLIHSGDESFSVPEASRAVDCLWLSESDLFFAEARKEDTRCFLWSLETKTLTEVCTVPLLVTSVQRGPEGWVLLFGMEPAPSQDCCSVFEETPVWENGKGVTAGRRARLLFCSPQSGELIFVPSGDRKITCFAPCEAGVLFAASPFSGALADTSGLYRCRLKEAVLEELLPPGRFHIQLTAQLSGRLLFFGSQGNRYGRYEYEGFYEARPDGEALLFAPYEACAGQNSLVTDLVLGTGQTACVRDGALYFLTTEEGRSFVRRLDSGGGLSLPLTEAGLVSGFDVGGGRLVYCGMKGQAPCELYAAEPGGEQPLTDWNAELRGRTTWAVPEPVSFTDREGARVQGWVLPPSCPRKGEQAPAVLTIHGGPRAAFGGVLFHELQLLAANGYYVLYCNPKGSDGCGNAFGDLRGGFGGPDCGTLMDFLDLVLERYPQIDSRRLGVTGGSYGGFLVNWIIGHSRRFAAAVSERSISNWITAECLSDIGHYFVPDQAAGSLLQGGGGALWAASPLRCAGEAETPTLFLHADQDFRCCAAESFQMFYVLKRKGVPCRLALFHGENHELNRSGRPQSRVRRLQELQRWLDRYLKPKPYGRASEK